MKQLFQSLLWLLAATLFTACGGGGESDPEPVKLATPAPSVAIDGDKATVIWSGVENAKSYLYELTKDGVKQQSSEVALTSYTFKMTGKGLYGFRVMAKADASGMFLDSDWSAQVTAQLSQLSTPVAKVVEGSVTNVAAKLSWGEIANAATYYYQLVEAGSVVRAANADGTQIELTGLKEGTAYKFRVKAVGSGSWIDSNYSTDVSFETKKVVNLAVPTELKGAAAGPVMILSWKAVDQATGYAYELYKGSATTAIKTANTTAATVSIENMEKGSYRFRVKAVGKQDDPYMNDSAFSEECSFEFDPSQVDLGLPAVEMDGVIRAFPGAEGGGMYTTGGRGGQVIHVTNLNDSGAGSLRAAVNQSGKRIIVFDVAGTIHLQSRLSINNGDVTIAGQTAPGDGICLADNSVYVGANNVIIRFIRFRMGDEKKVEDDAIWGRYQQDIIIDHCSMSWSTDECASFYANKNFTLQWCLLGESLKNSVHGKGSHGYGGIWGGKNASFHHNMLTCHDSRNARIDHPQIYVQSNQDYRSTHRGHVDYRNNLIYNWGGEVTYGGESGWFNIVGNYYKRGPASNNRAYFVNAYADYQKDGTVYSDAYGLFYIDGNVNPDQSAISADNKKGINWKNGSSWKNYNQYQSTPFAIKKNDATLCYTSTHSANDAYARVLENVGASLRRDAVDTRLVDDARNGKATYSDGGNGSTNGIIDTQSAVGGWPTLTATDEEKSRVKTDTDGDHIPDYYEQILGLDKSKNDASEKSLDPQGLYSNFEIYLHYLVKDITVRQTAGSTYKGLQ